MTNKEMTIELLAQTLAPSLFKIFGKEPAEMGFPIYETKGEVEIHLDRQFNPVEHWTEQGRKFAISMLNILEAGGLTLPELDVDVMCTAALKERPDVPPQSTETKVP